MPGRVRDEFRPGSAVQCLHMNAGKEWTLNQLGEMIERGLKAFAEDVAEIRQDTARGTGLRSRSPRIRFAPLKVKPTFRQSQPAFSARANHLGTRPLIALARAP